MLELTGDHLARADLITRQVVETMDQFCLLQHWQRAAIIEERQRLARNLHAGMLQSLPGITLQLQEVQRVLRGSSSTADERLHRH
jgi:signal transduction histidine kinase